MEYTPRQTTHSFSPAIHAGFFMDYPEAYQDCYEDAYPEMEVTTFESDIEEIEDDGEDIQPPWDDDCN